MNCKVDGRTDSVVNGTTLRVLRTGSAHRCALAALALAACAFLGSCTPAFKLTPSVPIRLASYEWPGSYWIDVAWKKGWFAEAGLNVERVDVDNSYFPSLERVASGQLDAMGFTQFDLVRLVAGGNDLVGIAAIDYSEGAEALVAKSEIHGLRDLKGKRLALHRGTYLEYLLTVVAEREGLNLADVTLLDRTSEASTAEFLAGKIDALFVWEPYVSQARAGGGHTLFSTADFPGLTYSVLTFRRDFVQAHPKEIAKLMEVWHRGERYVHEHPDESCAIVAQLFDDPLSEVRDLLHTVRILDVADNGRAFSYAAGFDSLHGSWRRMNDFMLERGLVTARVDSPAHLDSSFIRQLE
jgi:NitT/TauT family transport system substrate-binding protein